MRLCIRLPGNAVMPVQFNFLLSNFGGKMITEFVFLLAILIDFGSFKSRVGVYTIASPMTLDTSREGYINIAATSFQMRFLSEVAEMVERSSQDYLNQYLKELSSKIRRDDLDAHSHSYVTELELANNSRHSEHKIIFIKQVLDARRGGEGVSGGGVWKLRDFYTLRNVNFLKKLKKQLQKMQEEKGQEIRKLRISYLCQNIFRHKVVQSTVQPPYLLTTKLEPLHQVVSAEMGVNMWRSNRTGPMDILQFGRRLYELVNVPGAEIIDDYLSTIRALMQEAGSEKGDGITSTPPEKVLVGGSQIDPAEGEMKLAKVVAEINGILSVTDLYAKRQKLYAYLQDNLSSDYEQLRSTDSAQQDLADLFAKLKERGLDLFVTFIFGNFEFLELVHDGLQELLPLVNARSADDADVALLRGIPQLYADFKQHPDKLEKYEAYLAGVKALQTRSEQLSGHEDVHVYELLHNASQNVGSVTLNMIRAQCDEI